MTIRPMMMKQKQITALTLLALSLGASAQVKTEVSEFNQAGPFAVARPFAADTVNVKGQRFSEQSLLGSVSLSSPATQVFRGGVLPSLADSKSVGVLTFYVNNSDYLKGRVTVEGPKNYKLFVDGSEAGGELKLAPDHHTVAVKYLAEPSDTDSIRVTIDAPQAVAVTASSRHPYNIHDLFDGRRVRGVSLSADGKFVCVSYQTTDRNANARWEYELLSIDKQRATLVRSLDHSVGWMPRTVAWLTEKNINDVRTLYMTDPLTGKRTQWASGLPQGDYTVSPTEDYLIVSGKEKGPGEDNSVFEVVEMDDRQQGWRERSYLSKFDVLTGVTQRITYGSKGEYLMDISADGRQLLVGSSYSRLSKRPTEVMDVYLIDARTLRADTLLACAGFIGGAHFSPDGRQVLFEGSPEAFDRVGCQLPATLTPSMTEKELFLYDIATKRVTPLTRDFDPSVSRVEWSAADGLVYFTAEDRDYVHFYALNPASGTIVQLPVDGDNVYRFSLATHAPVVAWLSYLTMAPASAYVASLKPVASARSQRALTASSLKPLTLFDGHDSLADAELGTCQDWNFTNSRGDTVYGRLYLPHDLDTTRQYPMIVYYYGGCSPTSRYFESPYAPQYWNSLGYVAYIVQPSGATGFGQEWASRHVNTAGQGPAEDIIEGTRSVCKAHPFINPKKVGCMGASYGGFMTMYLQTQTDIFAAAVSHAGIANHTSYWGEGYWGYNYSEVSMANSYPWSHRQLYVDQSPLFNADKIHTPLLLLHGTADTNVPLIESLQMFTALKLLGRDVALVEVQGENHHILEYTKREKWMATQMAWFQRWLKDDPSWWDALYPKKHL